MSDGVMDLPHMAEVFEALRRGKHISLKDGDIFHALKKHEGVYEQLFSRLGFKLVHHARDFFYFLDTTNFTDLSARIAVFMFIMERRADSPSRTRAGVEWPDRRSRAPPQRAGRCRST